MICFTCCRARGISRRSSCAEFQVLLPGGRCLGVGRPSSPHLFSVRPECRAARRGASRGLLVSRYVPAGLLDMNGYGRAADFRSEEHTSELQSLMRISYAVFCLKKKKITK